MIGRFLKRRQAGDTIIEVMAAITILGLALGAAYGLSNRSFNTGVHTRDRIQALALAEGQVEFLKDIGLKGQIGSFIAGYTAPFCFDDSNGNKITNFGPSGLSCTNYKNNASYRSIYTLRVTYCSSSCSGVGNNVFTIRASWVAGGSGQQKQLTIFYKPQS